MTLHEAVAQNMRSHWDYAPEPEAVTRCPECGQYQGEGDVLYFYTGTGECVGCWRDVEKHSAEGFDYKCSMVRGRNRRPDLHRARNRYCAGM